MRVEVVAEGAVEVHTEPRNSVFRKVAIGPQNVTDVLLLDLLQCIAGYCAGYEHAGSKEVEPRRRLSAGEEIEAGIFRNGKNCAAGGSLLLHQCNRRAVIFGELDRHDDGAALGDEG